jgi:hypothetical protein
VPIKSREEIRCELDALKAGRMHAASVRTVSVLAKPGTPSSKTWPLQKAREQTINKLLLASNDLANLGNGWLDP